MAFTQSFTGKGTASVLDNSTVMQSQKGLADTIKEIEDIKFKVYQKNRDEFLKNSNIDPEFIFSDSARKTVNGMISNFNEKYGKLARQYNYNLPDDVRMQMQTEKNLIIAEQQNQTAQYELWRQHRDLVSKNPGVFSQEEFSKATDDFMQYGKYNQTMPAYEPHDFGQALNKAYLEQKNKIPIGMRPVGGGKQVEEYYTMDEGQYGGLIASVIASDPNARADLFKKIEQNREAIFANADTNGDNVLDSGEKENAIIGWVKKQYPRGVVSGTPVTIPGYGKSGSSSTAKVYEGKSVPYKKYGSNEYTNSYEFDGSKIYRNVSTNGAKIIYGEDEDQLAAGNISGRLLLYNPDKDVLVFEAVGSSESADTKSTTLIEVPAGNIQGVDDIDITINGVKGKVGEIRGYKKRTSNNATQAPQTTPPAETKPNKWDSYKRK